MICRSAVGRDVSSRSEGRQFRECKKEFLEWYWEKVPGSKKFGENFLGKIIYGYKGIAVGRSGSGRVERVVSRSRGLRIINV
jgi:hypothetical protein